MPFVVVAAFNPRRNEIRAQTFQFLCCTRRVEAMEKPAAFSCDSVVAAAVAVAVSVEEAADRLS